MRTYQVQLKPRSPYLTPWRNCTLWGRLSWIVADGRLPGWDIRKWLDSYRGEPPLVVGDAFPSDAVPVPAIFHALPRYEETPKTLPWKEWLEACATGAFPENNSDDHKARTSERMHVVMDRGMGKSLDGGLRSERGWQPEELILIAQVGEALGKQGLETLLTELCKEGWGQGRSYGYGGIRLGGIEELDLPERTGVVVTLGHCHPTDDLAAGGYWRWAGVPVRPHDFETRRAPTQYFTTMLLPGATFKSDKAYLGRIVGIGEGTDYVHYGYAPVWAVKAGATRSC